MTTLPTEFEIPLTTGAVLSESPFAGIPEVEPLDTGELEGDPALAFRRTMGAFATGVTVITIPTGDQVHGMTANAFMSVSLRPPLVLVSIDRRARLCGMLHEGMRFGVSVLAEGQSGLSDLFAGRAVEDVEAQFTLVHETPLVDGALAHVVAKIVRTYWGGDHSLFLGQVEFARYGEGSPLLFHGGRYERLIADPSVFSALPEELLAPILAHAHEVRFAPGDVLMQRGDRADGMMLLTEGEVIVERPGRRLTLGPGALVGEIEVLDPGGGRTATVTASAPTTCLAVSRDELLAVLAANPHASIALLEILSSRFRDTI